MPDHELSINPEERLFQSSTSDWRRNAMLTSRWSSGVGYAMSFKEAGDMLVKRGIEEQLQDLVFFPALYCYRHSLELSMKDIFHRWEKMQTFWPEVLKTHDLEVVWGWTRRVLEAAWPEGDTSELDAMESIVLQLAEVDPGGEQFRYDIDRHGQTRELPAQLARVDLVHVAAIMDKLLSLLWGGEAGIDAMDPGSIF
ncbi:MAG TPA: hypothetical protein VFU11_12700 [Solirubrobacterales bacterium]|nr:hypothetical protein [Solirubrobacterales bacterium]